MIANSHHGDWTAESRLWLEGPPAERSEGTVTVVDRSVQYRWMFRGAPQTGKIALFGPAPAIRAEWTDTFHARSGMTLHGHASAGVLSLYGTYPAGEGPEWGWTIELDTRDPEHLNLRMFNVLPEGTTVLAVDLRGSR